MVDGLDIGAPIITRHYRRIAAARYEVWRLHTDVGRWPAWQHDIASASIDGPFQAGAIFNWSTRGFDRPIRSEIHVVDAGGRTLWGGPANGIIGLHEWRFHDDGGGTLVETEESWAGPPVEGRTEEMRSALAASLERWLDFMARELG